MLTCSSKSHSPSSLISCALSLHPLPHGVPNPYAQALRTFSAQPQRTPRNAGRVWDGGLLDAAPLDIIPLGSYVTPQPDVGHAELAREGNGFEETA